MTTLAEADPDVRPAIPRTFDVVRYHDVSDVSGIGVVAQGVMFRDGTLAVRWDTPGHEASTAVWPSLTGFLDVHGHGGLTVVRFHDGDD
jgi:hypothetical protein